jgi:uncharacterized membrane protein YgdD (TMEM256/DUF423 family)
MSGATWIRIGAVFGGLAVAAGAFGAHGLRERLDARSLEIFETAAKYQMYHALALVAVGAFAMTGRVGAALTVAGWSFLVGILVFSGTLYGLSISGIRWLGMITPIGGVAMIVGWVALAIAAGSSAKPMGVEP